MLLERVKDRDSKKSIDYMIIFNNKTNAKQKGLNIDRQTLLPTNHFTDLITYRVILIGIMCILKQTLFVCSSSKKKLT